jgi:Zn-dependent protease with chaperone function
MFILRGLMVGLAFFGVCYCTLSLLVVILWQASRLFRSNPAFSSGRSLFALRVFPLAASAFVTLIFAMPAFFLLEGGTDEDLGTLILSLCALLLLTAGFVRVLAAHFGAARLLAQWLGRSTLLNSSPLACTFRTGHPCPPLLLRGIGTPKVLVSETAVALLSPEELAIAIRHEVGHMRFRDNLKKFILHGTPFPGMGPLERAWQEAAELAADESAVSSSDDALDLASALIKLCRLAPIQKPPALTTGLVELTALVNVRVQRLLTWNDETFPLRKTRWQWLLVLLVPVGYGVCSYGHVLVLTHQFTEWFIH